jgi:hypothetical protein
MVADTFKDLKLVGTSTKPMYTDKAPDTLKSQYAVVAIRNDGRISPRSNVVPVPFLGDQPTFTKVSQFIALLKARHRIPSDAALLALMNAFNAAKLEAMKGNTQPLAALIVQVKLRQLQSMQVLDAYGAEDLARMLSRLSRRVQLATAGQISLASLN